MRIYYDSDLFEEEKDVGKDCVRVKAFWIEHKEKSSELLTAGGELGDRAGAGAGANEKDSFLTSSVVDLYGPSFPKGKTPDGAFAYSLVVGKDDSDDDVYASEAEISVTDIYVHQADIV